MKKPHVILICADHLRYDVLGKGFTPNLDTLAGESLRFENTYCASPLCVPARGSLFTGMYPNSTGSLINPWEKEDAEFGYVSKEIDNLYEILARNGWECLHSGKQHLFTAGEKLEDRVDSPIQWLSTEKTYRKHLSEQGKQLPGGTAFRSVVPEMKSRTKTFLTSCSNATTGCYKHGEEDYFDTFFTEKLLDGMRNRNPEKPLFVSAMYLAPHPPFEIPDPWYSKYATTDVILPENVGIFYPTQSPLQLYNVTGILGSHYTKEEWRESWRVYLGLVSLLDSCVGRIIDELKTQDIYEDSLLIFTSDHGEMLGSHGLFQKMCMYQESIKIPLYLHLPSQTKGHDINENISHIDILPTLCNYLGIMPTHNPQGRILPYLSSIVNSEEIEACKRVPIYIQYDGNGSLSGYQRCIIQNNYKLVLDVFKDELYFELYQINTDPLEQANLIYTLSERETAISLFQLLLIHMRATCDTLKCPNTALTDFLTTVFPS